MTQIHFGVTLPQIKRPWVAAADAARGFESLGFDSLWVCDHLYGPQSPQLPILEAWSMVSAVAAITSRVEIGTLVTPAGMRNAAQLGKVIATADNIAGGRIIAGLGAGWMPREFTDFNVPFLSTAERLTQLAETVALLKRMWGDENEVSYSGKFVTAENVVCQPKPPRKVPVLIGGGGEKVTLKLVAREADIWNNLAGQQADLAHKVNVLKEHCDNVGRDFDEITVSQQCLVTIAKDEASAGPMADQAERIFGGHMGDPKGPLAITGTADQCCEAIQKHIDLGCTMFVMEFFGKDTHEPAQLFAEKVLPNFASGG
ncbi:MAG: LLM class flavin-dependent oxidoreductase [bacterium]|nr:LLM class flavin-dependent oxidoreductase [Gammaproteobacteria bacterium]HIL96970.1 LLM class flavin-dependent oxidoreductase [Pseudomonadales bacterium]